MSFTKPNLIAPEMFAVIMAFLSPIAMCAFALTALIKVLFEKPSSRKKEKRMSKDTYEFVLYCVSIENENSHSPVRPSKDLTAIRHIIHADSNNQIRQHIKRIIENCDQPQSIEVLYRGAGTPPLWFYDFSREQPFKDI